MILLLAFMLAVPCAVGLMWIMRRDIDLDKSKKRRKH